MKKIFIIIAFLCSYFNGFAQCPPGNVFLSSQADIDNFIIDYPTCTEISGYLLISGFDVTNLNGLSNLEHIGGDLSIGGNNQLSNLNGLSNLQSINGDLVINLNGILTDISALANINPATITHLTIENNPNLSVCNISNICTYLDDPGNPRTISGNATGCANTGEVEDACLPCPPGDVILSSQLAINNFITTYPTCTAIAGNVYIDGNDIVNLNGLSNIVSIGGNFQIGNGNNTVLSNLGGLNSLQSIGGNLHITENNALTNIGGLSNLQSIGGNLVIYENPVLTNLNGLSDLHSINGELLIFINGVLADISGLENLDPMTITNLEITENPNLSVCHISTVCAYLGWPTTRSIYANAPGCANEAQVVAACNGFCPPGGIEFNTQADIDAFYANYPTCTVIAGDVTIYGGNSITNLNGLSNIVSIEGDLIIENNHVLTSLDGLESLQSISGRLDITENSALLYLDALQSVYSMGGELVIAYNPALNDISGLENVNPANIYELFIHDNPNVAICNYTSFCDYLADPGNPRYIADNAPGCGSDIAVFNACNGIICPTGDIAFSTQGKIDSFIVNYPFCTAIGGDVLIGGSDITNLYGLSNLQSIGGDLAITNNDALTNIDGLGNVQRFWGALHIANNPSLTNIDGLSNIERIGGFLAITDNHALTNLNGLSSLQSIISSLSIQYNPLLTDISGLENLDPETITDLYIENNTNLSICHIATICDYLDLLPARPRTISGNALGCADVATVIASCPGPCPPGDIEFNTQAEIDAFLIDYPACTVIAGDVTIYGGNSITNLNGLNNIESIEGDLIIENNHALTSLDGLESLQSIWGHLVITENSALLYLDALQSLYSMGGELVIAYNPALNDISGLENVNPANIYELLIHDNPNVAICNYTSFCDYLADPDNPRYIANNAPGCGSDIAVLNACTGTLCPTGDITFTTQAEIDAFGINYPFCTEIEGDVTIEGGSSITNLNGLTNLESIGGYLMVENNVALANLDGLSNLLSIGTYLWIENNDALVNIDGLSNLQSINDILVLAYNDALTNINGLSNLQSIETGLDIRNNNALTNLDGLNKLESVGWYLYIYNNPVLININGLNKLESVGGPLDIAHNDILPNIDGLSSLESIGGYLEILDNPALTNLYGLSHLEEIGGFLQIANNSALPNLDGLNNLNSIDGSLSIDGNVALTDIFAIDNLDPETITNLFIRNNANLSVCENLAICTYLEDPTNPRTIYGNAPGCANETEVIATCSPDPCPTGDITFTTQAEVDAFIIDYPTCTEIAGNVWIEGSDIANLDGLGNLVSVGGDIVIWNNSALTDIEGLSSLTSIGGNLAIRYNSTLTDIDDLYNLQSIGGDLNIDGNIALINIDGLSGLQNIVGSLYLWDNLHALTNINGLSNVQSIGGHLSIRDNYALTNIDGLDNVESVGQDLYLWNNSGLTNINGLNKLESIGGFLNIFNNDALTNIDVLSSLQSIGGYLRIENNDALTDISGLENLDPGSITDLFIINNPNLAICNNPAICTYLDDPTNPRMISGNASGCADEAEVVAACNPVCPPGDVTFATQAEIDALIINYPTCTEIAGNVTISGNDITNLDGLNNLESIGGYLRIQNNEVLSNLDGLSNLQSIGTYLWIENNDALSNIDGLNNLNHINGILVIGYNDALTNLDGLSNIVTIGGSLDIRENDALVNLDGLNDLVSIGGYLYIFFNDVLENIDGLSNLEFVGLDLWIDENNVLENIDGLISLESIGGRLVIFDNPALTNIDGLSNLENIGANLSIYYNDAITNIDGLSSLQSIGGSLAIKYNDAITNIDGLSSLQSIEGILDIGNNVALSDISGIGNLDPETITNLYIENNTILSVCENFVICTYLDDPTNPRTISGNAPGCANETEVEIACAILLPIELVRFTAKPMDSYNIIEWTTASEENVEKMIVEASNDGINNWTSIGFVNSVSNTFDTRNYKMKDHNPYRLTYYRLRTVDIDGSEALSKIISVIRSNSSKDWILTLSPNPFISTTNLVLDNNRNETIEVVITDIYGREVKRQKVDVNNGVNNIEINLENQNASIYLVNIISDGRQEVKRIMKL